MVPVLYAKFRPIPDSVLQRFCTRLCAARLSCSAPWHRTPRKLSSSQHLTRRGVLQQAQPPQTRGALCASVRCIPGRRAPAALDQRAQVASSPASRTSCRACTPVCSCSLHPRSCPPCCTGCRHALGLVPPTRGTCLRLPETTRAPSRAPRRNTQASRARCTRRRLSVRRSKQRDHARALVNTCTATAPSRFQTQERPSVLAPAGQTRANGSRGASGITRTMTCLRSGFASSSHKPHNQLTWFCSNRA